MNLRAVLLASSLVVLGACRPKPTSAPYEAGNGPRAAELIAGAKPQLAAVAVPDAKVVANRVMRGNLSFLAQAPGRFRGSVQVSGNELVTLGFTETGYALRYKLDAFPTGFYHGPPSACAVEALLGVALDTEDLVALVLGGAPIIAEPYEITEQGWNAESSRETVTIRNASSVQRLDFAWTAGGWQFTGSRLWRRAADGSRGEWIWAFAHEEMVDRDGARLPARTRVEAPGKRKDNLIVIEYRTRDLDPAFAKSSPGDEGGEGGQGEGGQGEGGGEGADDWGGGDDGWETDEDGWESNDGAAPAGSTPAPAQPEPPAAPKQPSPTPAADAARPGAPKPAAVFTIPQTGLRDRGDLCR